MLPATPPRGSTRRADWIGIAILLVLTEAIYLPWPILNGSRMLFGYDYEMLHMRRLAFVRAALATTHRLPAWYPRELLGAPFLANLQSFPWIPTHLVLLLLKPETAFAAAVAMAAALSALFTYLYCRRAGLSQIGAIAAAWTFACSGFFAAHVTVGFLSSLEPYASLPLLLWLADRATDPARSHAQRIDLLALAGATALVVCAGHPQLPAYSVAAALLYVLWRGRGWGRAKIVCSIFLGIGVTLIVWWPMLLLIGRSTRILRLDPSDNDVVLPYHRLLGLIVPGIDGWPDGLSLAAGHRFTAYSHPGYFWDTFAYLGVLPLIAVAVLVSVCVARKRWPGSRWLFLGAIGIMALAGALPLLAPLRRISAGTILRCPSRLLYVCTFVLAVAFGVGIDHLRRWRPAWLPRLGAAAAFGCLAFHAWDLGRISSVFILPTTWHPVDVPEFDGILARELGDDRVAVSRILSLRLLYDRDDAGGYDSIFLADPYRALLALADAPPGLNEEIIDASRWPVAALQAAGVKLVITEGTRTDLELAASTPILRMYRVANPASRASLSGGVVIYHRPTGDRIEVQSSGTRPGVVKVLEAPDPGWAAQVDGARTPIVAAGGIRMEVAVPPGDHSILLRYRTPGRITGGALSAASLFLLVALVWANDKMSRQRWISATEGRHRPLSRAVPAVK